MAQITASANIANGNIIQPTDILPLYTAMTSGGGLSVSLSGSITGSATSASFASTASYVVSSSYALSSSYAVSSSRAVSALSSSYAVTSSFATSASYALSSSYAVTSSHAITASYYNTTQVNEQYYDGGGGVLSGTFKFIAGKTAMSLGSATSSAFPVLGGKTLGTNAWITANYSTATGPTDAVIVTSISSSGAILFDNNSPGSPNATVVFTGIYI